MSEEQQQQPSLEEAECLLQQLWADILGIDAQDIGRDDSFLELGGDSVQALRLISLAYGKGFSLTFQNVFNQPRLYDMASTVQKQVEDPEMDCNDVTPFSLLSGKSTADELQQKAAEICHLQPWQVEDIYPCTALQEGLLVLSMRRPGEYIKRFSLELQSIEDKNRFQDAWEHVVDTTPILRTRIVELDGEGLVQVVVNEAVDWHGGQRLDDYYEADRQQPLRLGTPLARFALVGGKESSRHHFVWTMHHALSDGWSMRSLIKRIELAYSGEKLQRPPQFQALLKHIINLDDGEKKKFWQDRFRGLEARPFPELPCSTYEPRADKTIVRHLHGLQWPKIGITPSTLIRAAWSILAMQYTGTSDVVFGISVFGRQAPVPQVEEMVAPTIATVPLRIQADSAMSLKQLLHYTQQQGLSMVPFEQIGLQNLRRINQETDQACQFQTLLTIQPAQQDNPSQGESGIRLKILDTALDSGKTMNALSTYAMHLVCFLREQGAVIHLSYDSTLTSSAVADRIPPQFEHILRQISTAENEHMMLQDTQVICEQDMRDVWRWNATVPAAAEYCLHEQIADIARRQPGAPALCAWDGELTYGEFDRLSTVLAHHLIDLGVQPNSLVGHCFEKSMWTSVALLAVMKAGGASCTMDTTQPFERLSAVVRQLQPTLLVSSVANKHLAEQLITQPVVIVDPERLMQLAPSSLGDPLPKISPGNLLCILFTSGTTGTPKAAKLTHRNIASNIKHQWDLLGVKADTRTYDFASYAFDMAWFNFTYTFAGGACLCVPSEDERRTNLASSMRSFKANCVFLTPSVARLLDPDDIPDLQTLITGGEAFDQSDKAKWTPHVDYICVYGPAECTFISNIEKAEQGSEGVLRMGKKAGLNTWVVDINCTQHLAPIGAIGELYLEGALVGDGYLGDPKTTAANFVVDPPWLLRGTSEHVGRRGRLYRTGDLVRYDPDGGLTFAGRRDAQVKIRGQRVELGDVEHHVVMNLNNASKPLAVALVIRPRQSSTEQLVVFLQIEGVETDARMHEEMRRMTAGLEERLLRALPIFMVPNAYIPLSSVPLTANGKTDRRELRKIGESFTLEQLTRLGSLKEERRPPETEMERVLQRLWAATLRISQQTIGRYDSFLRLGGDSIAAMRLVGLAQQRNGISITVYDVFKQPKLCDLAAALQRQAAKLEDIEQTFATSESAAGLDFEVDDGTRRALQEANVPSNKIQLATEFQSMCVLGALRSPKQWWVHCYFDLPNDTDTSRIVRSCHILWDQVEALRTAFFHTKGRVIQVVPPPSEPPISLHTTRDDLGEFFGRLCRTDMQKPAALGVPWTQFLIIKSAKGLLRLAIRLSHAQYDAITLRLVTRCINASYYGHELPKFAQFSEFLERRGVNRASGTAYWESLIHDASMTRVTAASCEAGLADNDSEQIRVEARVATPVPHRNVTPATTFTAVCAQVLSRVSDTSELLFARLVSGRAGLSAALQTTAGVCLNFVPVRVKCERNQPLDEVEGCLGQQFIDSLPYEGVDVSQALAWNFNEWGCTVAYENFDADIDVKIDGKCCSIGFSGILAGSNTHSVKIYGRPAGDEVRIQLVGCPCARYTLERLSDEIVSVYQGL